MRALLPLAAFALLGTACSALVASQLGDTGSYGPIAHAKEADRCALTAADAGNACSDCIEAQCASDVTYACNATGDEGKPWFENIQRCAASPDRSSYSYCTRYDVDAAAIPANDDTGRERASEICIHDKCLAGGTPPCRTCSIVVDKGGSANERAALEESTCGQCLRDKCGALLVTCCSSDIVRATVAPCGYDVNPQLKAKCAMLFVPNDAGRPGTTDLDELCNYDVPTCAQSQCRASCGM